MNKETIKEIVEHYFDLKIDTKTRKREYVEARAMYFKLTRQNTRLSLAAIGEVVNLHYASVLHGINQLDIWIERDTRIKNNYIVLRKKIRNIEDDKEELLQLDESILLRYAALKEKVKDQEETIEQMAKEYEQLYNKHHKREKFYTKYGFIN